MRVAKIHLFGVNMNIDDISERSWAEIDLDALESNYNEIKDYTGGKEIMAVVKANAYGHGDAGVCRALEAIGTKYFCVSNVWEAQSLREAGIQGNILIFGYADLWQIKEAEKLDFIYTIAGLGYAKELSDFAAENGMTIRTHIKLDTGMTRLGLESEDELDEIMGLDGIRVEGIYTHYSVADSNAASDVEFTKSQHENFIRLAGGRGLIAHTQNSGGILYHTDFPEEYVRAGIILYGQKPSALLDIPIELKPILTLKSRISQIKEIPAGRFISYGRTFVSEKPMKIAVVPIGYADGYPRLLSGKAKMTVCGRQAAVLGTVCMDMAMLDVTDISEVRVGDTVKVYSAEKDEFSVDDAAALCKTINYELLCNVGMRVPRIFIKGGKIVGITRYVK